MQIHQVAQGHTIPQLLGERRPAETHQVVREGQPGVVAGRATRHYERERERERERREGRREGGRRTRVRVGYYTSVYKMSAMI